jgi:hypothetical protein
MLHSFCDFRKNYSWPNKKNKKTKCNRSEAHIHTAGRRQTEDYRRELPKIHTENTFLPMAFVYQATETTRTKERLRPEMVCRELFWREVILRELFWREVIRRELFWREVIRRELFWREVIRQELFWREVMLRELFWREVKQ